MEFTSLLFLIFVSLTVIVRAFLPKKAAAGFLLLVNLVFYCAYSVYAAVFMLLFSLVCYLIGGFLEKKKAFPILAAAIAGITGLYFILRYSPLLSQLLTSLTGLRLELVFPLGFSYCMFKCIGYLADIYLEQGKQAKNFVHFAAYTLYFAEISMGPLTRAGEFLPQLENGGEKLTKERFSYGFSMLLFGLFKKLVFADRLAILIAPYYQNVSSMDSGFGWFLILIGYCMQLYLDFSGYTDMAVGISKMLGFETRHNFNAPMISQTMSEYWRRWHISLSSWLSDYVFTPLQFKLRGLGKYTSAVAAVLTLTLSGLWHDLSGNYLIWGIITGLFVAIDSLLAKKRKKLSKKMPKQLFKWGSIAITFVINLFVLVFPRAYTVGDAFSIIASVFAKPWSLSVVNTELLVVLLLSIIVSILSQKIELSRDRYAAKFAAAPAVLRCLCYYVLIFAVILFAAANSDLIGGFIYAQF